jgi:hypothetical protein
MKNKVVSLLDAGPSQRSGTLGVLLAAGKNSLADPEFLFQRLIAETSFRASPQVRERFLLYCKELAK